MSQDSRQGRTGGRWHWVMMGTRLKCKSRFNIAGSPFDLASLLWRDRAGKLNRHLVDG